MTRSEGAGGCGCGTRDPDEIVYPPDTLNRLTPGGCMCHGAGSGDDFISIAELRVVVEKLVPLTNLTAVPVVRLFAVISTMLPVVLEALT